MTNAATARHWASPAPISGSAASPDLPVFYPASKEHLEPMSHDNDQHKPVLTVLQGGKIDQHEFASLPLDRKHAMLQHLPARKKMELILDDPAAAELVHALQPQELYWLVEETGITDAQELIALASPDQCR